MKKNIFILFLLCSSLPVFAQTFHWAKNVTGKSVIGQNIVCDAGGNIYTSGTIINLTNSPVDMDFGPGVFNLTGGTFKNNGYIAKYDPLGNFIWAKIIFSANYENFIRDLKTDSNNNVYFIGKFKGTMDFDPGPGVFTMTNNNNLPIPYEQLFIEKLDSNGNFLWAKKIGDTIAYTLNPTCTVNPQGEIFVIDGFSGTMDFDPDGGVFNLTSTNASNTYVLKLNTNGQFVWVKQFTGNENHGRSIITDQYDNIYLAGNFSGTIDVDPNAGTYPVTGNPIENFYIVKLDAATNFLWAKVIISTNNMTGLYITDIHYDQFNNVYYTGYFTDTIDFDPGLTTDIHISNGSSDAFVSKLDASGVHKWTRSYGNTGSDMVIQMITDSNGNTYLLGNYYGVTDFDPSINGVYNLSGHGTYISKLDSAGNFVHVLSMGVANGTGNIGGNAIGKDAADHIYLTGSFLGTQDFNPGAGVYNLTSPAAAGNYMFICKLGMCGSYTNVNYTYCDSVNLWGSMHDSSEHFVQMFADVNGCDSNLNIDLTIKHSSTDTLHETECETFTINNITYNTPGFHTQTYTNAIGCDSLFVVDLTLTNPGTTNITQSLDTLTVFPAGYTYQWFDCNTGLPVAGATAPQFVPTIAGSYKAVVYFSIECSDTTACKNMAVCVRETELETINISPNPGNGIFNIVTGNKNQIYQFTLLDAMGNKLQAPFQHHQGHYLLNISAYPNGLFYLQINTAKGSAVYKILKTAE